MIKLIREYFNSRKVVKLDNIEKKLLESCEAQRT